MPFPCETHVETRTCEHGRIFGASDFERFGMRAWFGPIGRCRCCFGTFVYLDSGAWTDRGSDGRTWQPKDLCGSCGGRYVEYEYKTVTQVTGRAR